MLSIKNNRVSCFAGHCFSNVIHESQDIFRAIQTIDKITVAQSFIRAYEFFGIEQKSSMRTRISNYIKQCQIDLSNSKQAQEYHKVAA